jgi:protein TorT
MSKRSRSQRIGGLALATALGAATLLGSAGSIGLAQEATPQVGSAEDLASPNWTWPVQWVVNDEKQPAMYEPIDPASITKPWNICVSFPHLKDPYWLGADYVNAKVEEIVDSGIPVIDFVNGVSSPKVSAHALVSFYDMGYITGTYMKENLVSGDDPIQVAFFPGPQGAGWTDTAYQGFQDATKGTNIEIVATKWGDTGKDIQLALIEDVLQSNPDIDFIVGNAQAAVSGVQAVREAGLEDSIKILAFHQNPPVYDGIAAGDLTAAANDSTVIQGRMAVDMAVRLLEGQTLEPSNRAGPVITMMTPDSLKDFVWESTFAPKDYQPEFTVAAK